MKYLYALLWGLLLGNPLLAQSIVEAEYFIDQDPGVGKATKLTIPNKAKSIEATFDVNFSNLSEGNHFIVVRARDENNRWSLSYAARFVVIKKTTPISSTGSPIVAYEVIFIDDKGAGKEQRFTITPTNSFQTSGQFSVPSTINSEGIVGFGVRTLHQNGTWSLTNGEKVYLTKKPTPSKNQYNYTYLEYFLNSPDVGLGKATPLSFTRVGSGIETTLQLNKETTDLLPKGRNHIYFRVKTNDDQWSLTAYQPFDNCPPEGIISGFDIQQVGRSISIIDKSRYAADYTYDLGTGMNTLNAQVITQSANLSFQYYSGGTFKICQTVANFCKTETVCKEVFIDAPRLKAGKSLPTFQFKEDEPLKVVVTDLNDYFEDIGGKALAFTFIPAKNTLFKGRIDNNKTFVLAPQEDVFGTNLIGFLTMKGGGLETDFPFNVVVTPLPDPPKRRKDSTLPKQITLFEDSPPMTISSYLEQHYYDPDNEAFSFIRTFSDTSGLIPELSYNPTTRRTTFSLRLAPDYYGKGRIFLEMNDSISNPTNFLVGYDTIHVEVKQTLDPPVLIKSIPNATLSQGFGQRVWVENLDDHFRDADGDPLTYSASIDNSAVQLRVDNKRLIISANSTFIGSAIGRVSASDGLITVSTTFNINIIDGGGVPIINLQTVTFCASSPHTVNLREYIFDNNTPFDGLKISTRVTSASPNTVSVNTLLITIQNGIATFTSLSRDNATYSVEFSVKDSENKTGTGMVSVVVRGASITQLNATTLQASQGERYQWYNANGQAIEGATQRTFTISGSPTGVSVEVTQGSCKVRSSPFGLSVGLEDDLREENITLYPNPTNREVTLMLDGFYTGWLSIGIYDLTGRRWWEENVHKLANQFTRIYSLEYLPSGIYTLLIRTENSHIVRKLVKQ